MVDLLNDYPEKYPHLVIPTGGQVDRKLSLCHLDRKSCGPEWRDLTYFKNRFLDFGLCPPLEMTYSDSFTDRHYITGNTVRDGKDILPRLNYSRIGNGSARKRKTLAGGCRFFFFLKFFRFLTYSKVSLNMSD